MMLSEQAKHSCRDCGIEIIFKQTWKGTWCPVNAKTGIIHDCRKLSGNGQLSKKLVEARKEGKISWRALADNVRETHLASSYATSVEWIGAGTTYLLNASKDYRIPRWHNQPVHVEFWTEKDAMSGTI